MKVFHCDHCGRLVFFENTHCLKCGRTLAYLPDDVAMASLDPAGDDRWSANALGTNKMVRLCENYTNHNACNWAVPAADAERRCRSCRLTRVIPDLGVAGNQKAWSKIETAKRRLLYSLDRLGCWPRSKVEDAERGLAFEFLSDAPADDGGPVMTGHAQGLITLNIAEADDVERERRRVAMHEPYRTLLGHFRHEVGHYYWDLLLRENPRLEAFRRLFGDERQDYAKALERHYQQGASADWKERFVSAYAASHPWEDWAETWAHYLHMVDLLETASACGLSLKPEHPDEPSIDSPPETGAASGGAFNALIEDWFPLTYVLNNLNRGMGLPDAFPFVWNQPVVEKVRFIHDTVVQASTAPVDRHPA
ncbi:MAG: putative zinc-binding peptidase [Pirellulaceae bacterium]